MHFHIDYNCLSINLTKKTSLFERKEHFPQAATTSPQTRQEFHPLGLVWQVLSESDSRTTWTTFYLNSYNFHFLTY